VRVIALCLCLLGLSSSFAAETAKSPAALGTVIVDQIEIEGVVSVDGREVENLVAQGVGDPLDRNLVVQTNERIQAYYRRKGYEEVQISSALQRQKGDSGSIQSIVVFKVSEGKVTRVRKVNISGADTAEKLTQEQLVLIQRVFSISSGDPLDQDRIAVFERELRTQFAADDYVGVKLSQVELKAVVPEALSPSEKLLSTARWVDLDIRIELGDRVLFSFLGNTAFTRSDFLAAIDETRLTGFGQDYVRTIQNRIRELYLAIGYSKVSIESFTAEKSVSHLRTVSYHIQENKRVAINRVTFEGHQSFDSRTLEKMFYERAPIQVQRKYFVEKDIDKAVELLIEWIRSQGFLAAKWITVEKTQSPYSQAMDVKIYLFEGVQTRVRSLQIQGFQLLDQSQVLERLNTQVDSPLNLFDFNEGLDSLKSYYKSLGYLDFTILNEDSDSVIQYAQDNRWAEIDLNVSEGVRYQVSAIEVEGLARVREAVVLRELSIAVNDFVLESEIARSESRIKRLGLFSLVNLRVLDDPSQIGKKKIRILLQEASPGVWSSGLGFRSDLGARTFFQVGYSNIWRRNHTASLGLTANRRFDEKFCNNEGTSGETLLVDRGSSCFIETQAQLAYGWPWILGIPGLTWRPSVTFENTQFRPFDKRSILLNSAFDRTLLDSPALVAGISYTLEFTQQYNARVAADQQSLRIGYITPSVRLDTRDNSLSPTRGLFATSSFEFASPALGSQRIPFPVGYTRYQGRADYTWSPIPELKTYWSFRTGVARNTQRPPSGQESSAGYQVPLSKHYALGGAGSLRGFNEQELQKFETAIRGTLSYVNYRVQVDFPFAGAMWFGPFLDAANLKVDRYSFGDLRMGSGVGLHYQSPIGPVNFDWGFKISPQPNEDPYRFYFSLGVI
jgi:outer membrane protein insertion porin family